MLNLNLKYQWRLLGVSRTDRDGGGTSGTRAHCGGRNGPKPGEGSHPCDAGRCHSRINIGCACSALCFYLSNLCSTCVPHVLAVCCCCRVACSGAAQSAVNAPQTPWLWCISASRGVTPLWPKLRDWLPQSWRSFRWETVQKNTSLLLLMHQSPTLRNMFPVTQPVWHHSHASASVTLVS